MRLLAARNSRLLLSANKIWFPLIFAIQILLSVWTAYAGKPMDAIYLQIFSDPGFFGTIQEYSPPIGWILFQLVNLMLLTIKLVEDRTINKGVLLLRVGKREVYNQSYLWAAFAGAAVLTAGIVLIRLVCGLLMNSPMELSFVRMTVMFYGSILCYSWIVLILSQKTSYISAYLTAAVFIVLVTLDKGRYLPGQFALIRRQDFMTAGGIGMTEGMCTLLLWGAVIYLIGHMVSKFDFSFGE